MESHRQPAAAAAIAVSKVLGNDDLLIEILLRVGFPTTLVRAALVCKHWLGHVSDRAFLRRFRVLHPPRLLGICINDWALPNALTAFVPTLHLPPELATIIPRARFSLKDCYLPLHKLRIHDCRNGSVFIPWYDRQGNINARVYNPLCPQRGLAILPSLPRRELEGNMHCSIRQVLSQEDGDDMSYFCLHVIVESASCAPESEFRVKVYMLQDGCWHQMFCILDTGHLPHPRKTQKAVLDDNKIYLVAGLSDIIVMDLTSSSLSTFQFPPGADHRRIGATMLSRANDASGVYLIQAKEFQIRIWLHRGDNWMPVDTICLREMCDDLKKSGCTIKDQHTPLLMSQVVYCGDFLFLKMSGCVLQLDIKCRTLRKVYETKHGYLGDINPFMMIWPPKFPTLKYDPARNAR